MGSRSTSQHKKLVFPGATVAIDATQSGTPFSAGAEVQTINSLVTGGPILQRQSGTGYGTYSLPAHNRYYTLSCVTNATCAYRLSAHHSFQNLSSATIVLVGRAPTIGASTRTMFTIFTAGSNNRIASNVTTTGAYSLNCRRLDGDGGATSVTSAGVVATGVDFVWIGQFDYATNNLKMYHNGTVVYNSTFVPTAGTLDNTTPSALTRMCQNTGAGVDWSGGLLYHFQILNNSASDTLSGQIWQQFRHMVNL